MSTMTGIIAALPREVAPLVKGWKSEKLPGNRTLYMRDNVVVACAGMGPSQVALAVTAARALLPLTEVISVGLAGACNPALRVGDVVRAGVVIDRNTGERFLDEQYESVLVSTSTILSIAEKERLRVAYGAAAVDMEAATVARLARAHGLKFRAIKVISDAADFNMDGLSGFATEDVEQADVAGQEQQQGRDGAERSSAGGARLVRDERDRNDSSGTYQHSADSHGQDYGGEDFCRRTARGDDFACRCSRAGRACEAGCSGEDSGDHAGGGISRC
jgi:adenosylhomocysteine nucleosidase